MLGEQAPDAYATGAEVVQRLDKLAADCPVREGARVERLSAVDDGYILRTCGGDLLARAVVVATGDQNLPQIPALAGTLLTGFCSTTPPTTAVPTSFREGRSW